MNDTPCADCGVETLPTDHRRAEWYVVVDEVWPRTHGATVTACALLSGSLLGAGTANADVYYKNCAEARAAGVTPIHKGEPGYRPGLDRDGDGIACE